MAPALRGVRAHGLPIAVTGLVSVLYLTAGIIFATQLKKVYTANPLGGAYSTFSATNSIIFAIWALVAGLTRSNSLSIGLAIASLSTWSHYIMEVSMALPVHPGSGYNVKPIGAADAIHISATVIFLLWVAYDFCREKVSDRIKHGHDGYLTLN